MAIPINSVNQGDCLEVMKCIPDKSVDLVLTDPPYNIGKADWDKIPNYIEWLGIRLKECNRVLKDNGSLYFFHNDFEQMAEMQVWIKKNLDLMFKQLIVWNKKFTGSKIEKYLDGYISIENLRNYRKMAEYCLYYVNSGGCYTEWDKTGLGRVKLDVNNFQPLRKYFYEMLCYIGKNVKQIEKDLGHRKAEHCFYVMPKKKIIEEIGQKADHCFQYGSTQWELPTAETYNELATRYNLKGWSGWREYESLRREYESLRREYESLRYAFNNQKNCHSVWNYDIAEKIGHITPKPVDLTENIILHSSNESDLVLDCFAGSGTTAIACINLNRNYILIEKEKKYIDIINKRIKDHVVQPEFNLEMLNEEVS